MELDNKDYIEDVYNHLLSQESIDEYYSLEADKNEQTRNI